MIDPVTLAVFEARLEQIPDEADVTLCGSAFNSTIAGACDASHGPYHAEADVTLAQGMKDLPIFVGAMPFAVPSVIGGSKGGDVSPGDKFPFNDPHDGTSHSFLNRLHI